MSPDQELLDLVRRHVSESVARLFEIELANEEAMRRDAMSKQRSDEFPPPTSLSTVIDSVAQGLPVGDTTDEAYETLVALLVIRDLLPGDTEVWTLL